MSDERRVIVPRPAIVDQLVNDLFTFLDKRAKELDANLTESHSATFSVAVKMSTYIVAQSHSPEAQAINRFSLAKHYQDVADDMVIIGTSIH